jgi:hypothetical protein
LKKDSYQGTPSGVPTQRNLKLASAAGPGNPQRLKTTRAKAAVGVAEAMPSYKSFSN